MSSSLPLDPPIPRNIRVKLNNAYALITTEMNFEKMYQFVCLMWSMYVLSIVLNNVNS